MPFELQRKADPKNIQLKADMADRGASKDMRMLAAGGFDAASNALAPVQLDGGKSGMDPAAVQRAAQVGVSGSGGKLPHLGSIQAAFGRHDVSAVQAHGGGTASSACEQMGAHAYASGNAVAFKGQPDLHTAAHEAAHIVQQRAGVSLSGGVGKSGDAYERHADQVADAVVQGKSAEGLLDKHAGGGSGSAVQQQAVQMKGKGEGFGKHLKSGMKAVSTVMPGGELWESSASGSKIKNRSGKDIRLKVWAMRAGSLIGQVFAPLAMTGAFFLTGAIKSYKRSKKMKKKEKWTAKDTLLAQQLTNIMSNGTIKGMCKEANLDVAGVTSMLLLRLGLPRGEHPIGWYENEMEAYNELEKGLANASQVIQRALAGKGLIAVLEEDQQRQEDNQEQPDLQPNPIVRDGGEGGKLN